jgi:hypothetical protein
VIINCYDILEDFLIMPKKPHIPLPHITLLDHSVFLMEEEFRLKRRGGCWSMRRKFVWLHARRGGGRSMRRSKRLLG